MAADMHLKVNKEQDAYILKRKSSRIPTVSYVIATINQKNLKSTHPLLQTNSSFAAQIAALKYYCNITA